MSLIHRLILFSIWILLNGCLTTRAELREVEQQRTQVSAAQERQAQAVARLDEYDQQFRNLSGRLDVAENQIVQINAGHSDRQSQDIKMREDFDAKFKAYEEALKKLELEVKSLNDELRTLKTKKEAPPAAKTGSAKDAYANAEAAFGRKDWKQAIVEYENYRKAAPKGKSYPAATLKIGMSFHELNMKDEAKAFYEEVLAKFPESKEAKKASQRLKSMK